MEGCVHRPEEGWESGAEERGQDSTQLKPLGGYEEGRLHFRDTCSFQGPGEKRGRRRQDWKLLGVGTFREGDQQLPVGQCPVKRWGTLRTTLLEPGNMQMKVERAGGGPKWSEKESGGRDSGDSISATCLAHSVSFFLMQQVRGKWSRLAKHLGAHDQQGPRFCLRCGTACPRLFAHQHG